MDAAYASLQARLDTFTPPAAPKTKARRPSNRSKKAAPKAAPKAAWPLTSPTPIDLATAGFVWRPTAASQDNVQCFSCECQLDGWEAEDAPILEHITHSPDCGFAINMRIRLRNDEIERIEEDPMSNRMVDARRATFANMWPLDPSLGYPTTEQMVAAGWCYDPTTDTPDGVTCPYCLLSLDAWDAGDNPMEEHRRRAADCLFFSLQEAYNPVVKPKATKGKRASSRSSTASQKAAPKRTRGSKASTKSNLDKPLPPPPDETFAEALDVSENIVIEPSWDTTIEEPVKAPAKAPAKGQKTKKATKTRASTISNASSATTRSTRGRKRTSEQIEDIELPKPAPKRASKRTKVSNVSSVMPESVFVSTPVHSPHVTIPALAPAPKIVPEVVLKPAQGAKAKGKAKITKAPPPKPRTPRAVTPEPVQIRTPEAKSTVKASLNSKWEPVNIEEFFDNKQEMYGLISNVLIDSSLDKENMTASMDGSPSGLVEAVKAGLTSPEKKMTLEQWVMYNAQRGEEMLRMECERQIAAFDVQARRALATLDAIPAI